MITILEKLKNLSSKKLCKKQLNYMKPIDDQSNKPYVNRPISPVSWTNYIAENYPDWYDESFKQKWPVKIVYYESKIKNCSPSIYTFLFDSTLPIKELKLKFLNLFKCQHLAIINAFGFDIGNEIIKYLPEIPIIDNNYFYVHAHVQHDPEIIHHKTYRLKVPNNFTVPNVHCALRHYPTQSRYTILRLKNDQDSIRWKHMIKLDMKKSIIG